jgi:hypothetical protein
VPGWTRSNIWSAGWARPDTDLSLRVAQLSATRAAALDAHATELRRIERSLHDGTRTGSSR